MKNFQLNSALMTLLLAMALLGCKDKGYTGEDGEEVRVLVIYTAEAEAQATENGYPNIHTLIDERINYANGVFAASGIVHQLTLAGAEETSSQDSIAAIRETQDLKQNQIRGWLSTELGDETSELFAQRHAAQADLIVILHTPLSGSTSGQARVVSGVNRFDYERSHAAVYWNSANTFVHEIGHLFGAEHDQYRLNSVDVEPNVDYGQGYVDLNAGFRTLMSYSTGCDDADVTCPQVALFSNPNLQNDGVAAGSEDFAYNACLIAQRGEYVANFFEYWSGEKRWQRSRLSRNCTTELLALD
jgi:hypothetical protein